MMVSHWPSVQGSVTHEGRADNSSHTRTYSQFNASVLSREVSLPPQVRQVDTVSSSGVMMNNNKKG